VNNVNKQKKAITWIIGQLNQHNINYQIVGGLAAITYGSKRELADIDLYISFKESKEFLAAIKEYIYWGPEHQKDTHWDITYLKINYEGQKIEVGDSNNAKIFDSRINNWIPQNINYNTSVKKNVFGCEVNVINLAQLIEYKSALNRDVDIQDIEELKFLN
jgi:predicted nucleotidyltransferase